MIPPAGFKAELYPLRHRFAYSFGLNGGTTGENSTMITLVKNYTDATNLPTGVNVNPHADTFAVDGGAICAPMSIVDKLSLSIKFNITENLDITDKQKHIRLSWQPIFFSFPEKLDAADEKTTTTVAALLELTKDATKEDITPAWANKLTVIGASDKAHPVSTVNFTEVFGTMNLTTDTTMEGVPWDETTLQSALQYYTNKGALRACLGRKRFVHLTTSNPTKQVFIRKFVPRAVRRIVPYSFFAIVFHIPTPADIDGVYTAINMTNDVAHVGIKALVRFDEWNPEFKQEKDV